MIQYYFWLKQLKDSKPHVAIFLDLGKALYKVNHEVHINKLNSIGIMEPINNIFRSDLKNTEQKVRIG